MIQSLFKKLALPKMETYLRTVTAKCRLKINMQRQGNLVFFFTANYVLPSNMNPLSAKKYPIKK